jgi:hypothetical protein
MSPPCCLASVPRGVARHRPLPSTLRLYPTPTPLHPSPSFHLFYPSLSRRKDMDPTSRCWVLAPLSLNLSIPTGVCQLSSHQSNPAQHDLSSAHRLLNYVSSHRNPRKTIHPSSMALWGCTDVSYLSRPNSIGQCGWLLGDPPPYLINPPPESRRQSLKTKQTLIRASRLIQAHPSVTLPTSAHHAQRPPPCFLPAHTRGGNVCGRGGVRCRFWRWGSVG